MTERNTASPSGRVHSFLLIREPGKPDRIVVWDTQEVTVGRAADNDIHADQPELSRHHAVFGRQGKAWVIKNLSEANSTFVGAEQVSVHVLSSKEVVRVADLQIAFYQEPKNPLTLGLHVDYASQLKDFDGPGGRATNADATMLGLIDTVSDAAAAEDEFEVRPAGDFEVELAAMSAGDRRGSGVRDLDLELAADALEVDRAQAAEAGSRRLSLHLEIEGLTPELRGKLAAVEGKLIELPGLRIRVKGDDAV